MFYSILDSRIRHVDAAVVTIAVSTVPSMARTESKNTAEKTKNCDGGCDGARKYRAVLETNNLSRLYSPLCNTTMVSMANDSDTA